MAVAFESYASNHGDAGTLVIDKPVGLSVGDLMLAHICIRGASSPYTIVSPAGWSRLYRRTLSGTQYVEQVNYKLATAGDVAASNFTFTLNGAASASVGTISRYSGVHQTKPFDNVWVDAPVASGTTLTCPSQTPRYATALALAIGAGIDDVTASGWADNRLGNTWTERYDVQHDGVSYDLAIWAATCPLTGKEPSGRVTATLSGACVNGGAMILLAPTTSTGTPERFNYCANPKAELNTDTWAERSTGKVQYIERHVKADAPGTPPAACDYVFKVKNLAGMLNGRVGSGIIPVAAGDVVTLQAHVCGAASTPCALGIEMLDKNMASLGFVVQADFTANATWYRTGTSLTVSHASAAWAIPIFHNNNNNAIYWFTLFEAECQGKSGRHPEAYFDGDSAGCEWVGTRHASTTRIKTHPWRRNLIANPRVANNLDGWTGNDAATVPERITNPPVSLPSPATACVRWKKDGGTVWKAWGAQIAMRPGLYYHLRHYLLWAANGGSTSYPTVYVRPEKADEDGSDSARFADEGSLPRNAGAWIYPSACDVDTGSHQWLGVNGYAGTSPEKDPSYCWLRPRLELYSWGTQYIYTTLAFVDQQRACLEESAYCANDWQEDYRDGDSDDWEWDGTAHASSSREKTVEWTSTYIRINNDAASTDDNDVALTLHAGSSAGAVTQMRFSDDGETYGDWVSYATSRAYQLPPVADEDPHTATVYVQFKDAEGNVSAAYSDSITLQIDWTSSLILEGGASETDLTVVPFVVASVSSAGALADRRWSEDTETWTEWESLPSAVTTYEFLTSDPEAKTVYVQFRDEDGNTSPAVSDGITLVAQTFDITIVINDDDVGTDDNDVIITISGTGCPYGHAEHDATDMCFSENDSDWTAWETFSDTKEYQLPAQSDEDPHELTVYAKFKDASDTESASVNDSIILTIDWTELAVDIESVSLNDGIPIAGATVVPMSFGGFSSAGEVVSYCYSVDGGAASAWADYVPNLSLPGHPMRITVDLLTTGEHYVGVYLKDDDDNTLLIGTDDIVLFGKEDIDYDRPQGVIPVRMYADSSQVTRHGYDSDSPGVIPVRIVTSARRRR